jgi:hypothetical protein
LFAFSCFRFRLRSPSTFFCAFVFVAEACGALQAVHAVVVAVDVGAHQVHADVGGDDGGEAGLKDLATLTSTLAMVYRAEAGTAISPLLCDGDWSLGGGEASRRKACVVSCPGARCGAAPRGAVGSIVLRSGEGGRESAVANGDCVDRWRAEARVGLSCKSVAPLLPFLGTELRMRRARRAAMCDNDVGLGHRFEARPRGSRWRGCFRGRSRRM